MFMGNIATGESKETSKEKLIGILSFTRDFSLPRDDKKYIIKRRLMGKTSIFIRCCGERMLNIKEVKFEKGNEDGPEEILGCTYHFCSKCGTSTYDDGSKSNFWSF